MPDQPHTPNAAKPTRKQLAYLRALANRSGQTFTYPRTRAEASREIGRLRGQTPTPHADRQRERRQISDDMATHRGDDAQVRTGYETSGYGSTATWKRGADS